MTSLHKIFIPALCIAATVSACRPDKMGDGNGLSTPLTAAFTVTPVAGKTNTYLITNTTPGSIATRWDIDKGTGFVIGKQVDTVFYPDAGTYSIKMQAMGKGGVYYDAAAVPVVVATSDPVAGNLVQGGKMDPADDAKWNRLQINAGVTFALSGGKMVATGGNGGHGAIWQTIQVQANKKYRFAMIVSGSGATDTWFEVYFGTTAPVANNDYSSGGTRIGLNTWAGCGNSAFNGNISAIGCSGSLVGKNGDITFTTAGTIYLLIKTGGANLGTSGISIDNVELRGS